MSKPNLGPTHALAIQLSTAKSNTQQLMTRNPLQAAQIGLGGLLVNNGGSITIQAPGTLNLGGGVLSVALSIMAGTTISAGTSITAGTSLNGATLATSSDAQIGGILRVPSIYSNSITSSFRVVYTTSVDGSLGFNLSSREYKQDIEDHFIDIETAMKLRIVAFRYIAAVEKFGDDAAVEIGLIAEEVHDLGLHWLVDYDAETKKPDGIKFDRLALVSLALSQAAYALAQQNANDIALIKQTIGL